MSNTNQTGYGGFSKYLLARLALRGVVFTGTRHRPDGTRLYDVEVNGCEHTWTAIQVLAYGR